MERDRLSFGKVKLIIRSGLKILVADAVIIKSGKTVDEYGALCILAFVKFEY